MSKYSGKGASMNGVVYVCNFPPGTDENMLAEHFGTIGLLKKDKRSGRPKIWLYHDKMTNELKGDATVTYEDPHAAAAAVEWFNNKDFHGAAIGVFPAESKSKDDLGNQAGDPVLGSDLNGLDEAATDLNDGAGRGRGKAWQQDGDWLCTNTRGGRGGGYKELDEEEIEETKRRRQEAEEDDGEMYDEFGNLKKKFRSKTQQAENALGVPGVGLAGWEVEELGTGERDRQERSGDRGRERDEVRVRHRSRERDRLRERDRDREYLRERERDRDRSSRYRN